uniref:ethanolamine-phosphate cytidylyltransferase n=1 Tax=Neospora caninum (strain Liverpool) TaxID=572307 RepID=A0A0F7UMJ7_NEOCL|nr:TPA: phosphoethanolamine cytidylyltransferase,putative [Neospora caninum Liverpool]
MTAVAASGVPGPGRSGALASSSERWPSSPFISSSYLHKLIFLYLRINADETLSATLRHWRSSCCQCASPLSASLHASSLSAARSSVSTLSACPRGGSSSCGYCGCGGEKAAESPSGEGVSPPCCFCCCVRDPKWTAEADAEFSALRAHLLQFVARGEASADLHSDASRLGEKQAGAESPSVLTLPRDSTGENRAEGSSRDCTFAASRERTQTDNVDADAGLGGHWSQTDSAHVGKLEAAVSRGLPAEAETGRDAPGLCGAKEERKTGTNVKACHRAPSPQEQETRCSDVVSHCGSEEATRVEQEERTHVTLSTIQMQDAGARTPEKTGRDDRGVPDGERRVHASCSGLSGDTAPEKTLGELSVRRGSQSRFSGVDVFETKTRAVQCADVAEAAGSFAQLRSEAGATSSASAAVSSSASGRDMARAACWATVAGVAGLQNSVSSPPHSVSCARSSLDCVPAYHWNALPPVLPVSDACSAPLTAVSPSPSSPLASLSEWQTPRPSPLSEETEEGARASAAALSRPSSGAFRAALSPSRWPVCLSPQLSPFRAGPACGPGAPIRIYVDGVFDLLHSGHFNALRQARQLGGKLVVGICSDAATFAAKKCRPIYTETERAEIVRGCKWVDEVIVGTPYEVSVQMLDRLNCAFAAHGDDWVVGADGTDAYAGPRQAGRMKLFKRTEGISTSTIVSRLLQATANVEQRRRRGAAALGDDLFEGEKPVKSTLSRNQAVTQPTRVQRFARDSLREQKESLLTCSCGSKKREKDDRGADEDKRRHRDEKHGKRSDGAREAPESDSPSARAGEELGERGGSDAGSSANLSSFSFSSSDGEGGKSNGESGARKRQGRRESWSGSDRRHCSFGGSPAERERNANEEREKKCCSVRGRHRPRKPQDPEERRMLMSTKRLLQFIGQPKRPKKGGKIVYVDGSFDVFHVGHLRILEKAKQLGDYLIVGIHDDETVARVKGAGFPVLNLHERALNVLAMRVVDEVIIGAPWVIPHYMLKQFQIDVVVRGSRIDSIAYSFSEDARSDAAGESGPAERRREKGDTASGREGSCSPGVFSSGEEEDNEEAVDPYRVPKELGVYREVESSSSWTTRELVERILANRKALMETIETRCSKEANFWRDQEQGKTVSMMEL